MQKITPFLWFDDQAEEAVKFYTSIFKNSKVGKILSYAWIFRFIAAIFGSGGIETASADSAELRSYTFLAIFVISFLSGRRRI